MQGAHNRHTTENKLYEMYKVLRVQRMCDSPTVQRTHEVVRRQGLGKDTPLLCTLK